MSMKVSGFDDLLNTLDSLGKVGDQIGKKAIREGLKPVLNQMKKDAPKDDGQGFKKLRVTGVKQFNSGTIIGYCGIDSKNWDDTKHLLFQHYGYSNHGLNFKGLPIGVNVGWMTLSYEKVKSDAENSLKEAINRQLDTVFKR